ncbi:MAG: hypothetical protein JWM33_142 [Caulobacteraceae bacterium]|nr:hypothetical protein [Caulobacteraceae bacterium]
MLPDVRSAEAMLKAYQGAGPAGITITIDEWLRLTDLGALSRRTDEMRAIDDSLRAYQLAPGAKEAAFIRLKSAFDNWIRFQQRQGKIWTQSDRNKKGAITRLHDQITLQEAGRSVAGMKDTKDWEARQTILQAEREALGRLFAERTMVFKTEAKWARKAQTGGMPVIKVARAAHNLAEKGAALVKPDDVSAACKQILGQVPPEELFQMMGTSFSGFCSAASTILGAAVSPVKLLADVVKFGMAASTRYSGASARYMFRDGAADASLNAVLQMINDEMVMIAVDAAKQTGSIVGTAFGAGPIVSAASATIDLMINLKRYRRMAEEVKEGNLALSKGTLGLELFNASPVLGCYFLLMADTSVWINFSVHDIGTPGWMDTVETMRKRAEPIREKARELIRTSKIALSGTEGFNGLEWEPSWRNNKLSYLASAGPLRSLKNKIMKDSPKGPDKGRIVGMGSAG